MGTNVNTHHIVALGAPGAGKTVYLAVLHHLLTSGQVARGLQVKMSIADNAELSELYAAVANPTGDFPPPTGSTDRMRTFVFDLSVQKSVASRFGKSKIVDYHVLRVTYVDYAGEWLTDSGRQNKELHDEFQARIDEADGIIAFLDGEQLRSALISTIGDSELTAFDRYASKHVAPILRLASATNRPVVVVITKWDLVSQLGTKAGPVRLSTVVEWLSARRDSGLASLVDARSARSRLRKRPLGGVWIVPVSSTGDGFVRYDEQNRTVEKSGSGRLQPYNILIPFSLTLCELVDLEIANLRMAYAQGIDLSRFKRVLDDTPRSLRGPDVNIGPGGIGISLSSLVALGTRVGVASIRLLSRPAQHALTALRSELREVAAHGLPGVNSTEGAMLYFGRHMRRQVDEFRSSPESQGALLWRDPGVRDDEFN